MHMLLSKKSVVERRDWLEEKGDWQRFEKLFSDDRLDPVFGSRSLGPDFWGQFFGQGVYRMTRFFTAFFFVVGVAFASSSRISFGRAQRS